MEAIMETMDGKVTGKQSARTCLGDRQQQDRVRNHPAWAPVSTNPLTGGASYFSDPTQTTYPSRFYRLRSP